MVGAAKLVALFSALAKKENTFVYSSLGMRCRFFEPCKIIKSKAGVRVHICVAHRHCMQCFLLRLRWAGIITLPAGEACGGLGRARGRQSLAGGYPATQCILGLHDKNRWPQPRPHLPSFHVRTRGQRKCILRHHSQHNFPASASPTRDIL